MSPTKGENPRRSLVWEFFSTDVTDGTRVCILCRNVFKFDKTKSTSNMLQHVKKQHHENYLEALRERRENHVGQERQVQEDLCQEAPQCQEERLQGQNKLLKPPLPPSVKRSFSASLVWKFFDKLARDETIVCCKLCSAKFKFGKTKSTSTMMKHVKKHHHENYVEALRERRERHAEQECQLQEDLMQDQSVRKGRTKEKFVFHHGNKMRLKSFVWDFYAKFGEDQVICNLCQRPMKRCLSGTTSNMMKHIRTYHPESYREALEDREEEIRRMENEKDVNLDNNIIKAGTDETQEDIDDIADTRVQDQRVTKEMTKEKFVFHHSHKMKLKSFVWDFFVKFREDLVICKLCQQSMKWSRSTSNMRVHVKTLHPKSYREALEDREQEIRRVAKEKDVNLDNIIIKTGTDETQEDIDDIADTRMQDQRVTKEKFVFHHSHKMNLKSFVWDFYLKFREDQVICKLCQHSMKRHRSTSNMITHIKTHHPKSYREALEDREVEIRKVANEIDVNLDNISIKAGTDETQDVSDSETAEKDLDSDCEDMSEPAEKDSDSDCEGPKPLPDLSADSPNLQRTSSSTLKSQPRDHSSPSRSKLLLPSPANSNRRKKLKYARTKGISNKKRQIKTKKQISRALVSYLAEDLHSSSVVTDAGLQKLVGFFDRYTELPTSNHVSSKLHGCQISVF